MCGYCALESCPAISGNLRKTIFSVWSLDNLQKYPMLWSQHKGHTRAQVEGDLPRLRRMLSGNHSENWWCQGPFNSICLSEFVLLLGEHLLPLWEIWVQLPAWRHASFQTRSVYTVFWLEWNFEGKYLQDRFAATVMTQPHKDVRKLDGLLPVFLPRWSGCEDLMCDEVAIA